MNIFAFMAKCSDSRAALSSAITQEMLKNLSDAFVIVTHCHGGKERNCLSELFHLFFPGPNFHLGSPSALEASCKTCSELWVFLGQSGPVAFIARDTNEPLFFSLFSRRNITASFSCAWFFPFAVSQKIVNSCLLRYKGKREKKQASLWVFIRFRARVV